MKTFKQTINVFPKQNIRAYKIILSTSIIYFILIAIVLYVDNTFNNEQLEQMNFFISYYLLLLSISKFYITTKGLINNDIFRIFFNIYFNGYICIYIIFIFLSIIFLREITASLYISGFIILFIQLFEGIYFYMFYYNRLPVIQQYYFKKLGVSQKLNDAYRIRQKLLSMKELLVFRAAYLIGTTTVFNLLPQIQDLLQIIDIFLNLITLYFLQFHINCENEKYRIITLFATFFSLIKDILFIVFNFILTIAPVELKLDEILRNLTYTIIYFFILYYGFKDYKLFGSGLKRFLKEGKRSRLSKRGRMIIQ